MTLPTKSPCITTTYLPNLPAYLLPQGHTVVCVHDSPLPWLWSLLRDCGDGERDPGDPLGDMDILLLLLGVVRDVASPRFCVCAM